jgi:8-oxo-dGTP pyrophosphatase MutT (NUDIX family)
VHVTEAVLAPLRARYGSPALLEWRGEVSAEELALATYDPARTHDVTLFILGRDGRIALIRKPHFGPGVWRPPGGGIKRGEGFEAGATREAREETGVAVRLEHYLVDARARFTHDRSVVDWRTHVFLAHTDNETLATQDPDEIAGVRWGTLDELRGPIRARLLATERALWRYRVALHDAALEALESQVPGTRVPGTVPYTLLMRTAVPYAQISVQVPPISDVSNRIARIAFAPFSSAASTMRWVTSARLSASALVMPLSSPPSIDFRPAPNCEPMLRERTVSPNTSP